MNEIVKKFIEELDFAGIPHQLCDALSCLRKEVLKICREYHTRDVITQPHDLLTKYNLSPYLLKYEGQLSKVKIGITEANYGIAWSGGIVEIYNSNEEKKVSLLPEIHIAILKKENIIPDFGTLFKKTPPDKDLTIITGPSKTADIEKIVVKGAHGPKELFVVIF